MLANSMKITCKIFALYLKISDICTNKTKKNGNKISK